MIFLCFSSKDRENIVESVYYHLANMGLSVWYDRKEILMGENRNYQNFDKGVLSCDYAVIVLSKNSINSKYANEEIDLIHKNFLENKIYVFPVFYNISAAEVPFKYLWLKKLIYKELNKTTDSRGLCNHIVCKVFLDEISKMKLKNIIQIQEVCNGYIEILLKDYLLIDGINYNARITLLYAIIKYMQCNKSLPYRYLKAVDFIFSETKLNLPMDKRETLIFERLFILLYNYFA